MTRSLPYTELADEIRHKALVPHFARETCPECRVTVCLRCKRILRISEPHACATTTTEAR